MKHAQNPRTRTTKNAKVNKRKMTREEIEKKKKRIIKTFIIILIVFILSIIAYIANDFIILDKNKTTNLVINNKNVTSNLKKEILIQDDEIYISKQDLANFFDKYIYEETETNQIVTTYDRKVATIGFEENVITINGSKKNTYAHAIKQDDTTYIPINELKDVYEIDITNIEDSKVITIDSVSKEQKKAIVTSNMAVKSSTNFIAKTVDRVKKGDYVIVVSESDGYTRVRTANGKIGVVKSKKLANTVVTRQEMEEEKQIEGKVNLVWDYYSEYASAPDRSGTTIDGINVVSPAFFHLNKNGKLVSNVGTKGQAYIQWAHQNGYKVWPMVQNAGDGMMSVTSSIMNSYEKRQDLIESILNMCIEYQLDGINIDFENMKKEDKDLFSRFIIELTPRMKEMGLVVSVDVTAPDGSDTWSLCFDRHVIGDVADYIVFMAYDEYGASSEKAGTTAGYDWVELSLKKFLETEEIESDKIILAVPLYARLWTVDGTGKVLSQKAVSMKDIEDTLPEGVKKEWNDSLKQNYVEFTQDGNIKKIWIEDMQSLKAKVGLISQYNLGGIASWEKDMEADEVWQLFKESLK